MKTLKYSFGLVDSCNMCGAEESNFKILGKRLNQSQGFRPKRKIGISTTIAKCKNCGLIFSNPQPIPNDINNHYGTPPEDYWKDEYFVLDDNYFSPQIQRLKDLIDFKPGLKTLDIGAGLGKCMIALEKKGCEAYGFEPSEPFYQRAIQKMKISPDRLTLGSIEDANYPENYFDFITFGAVLEHLYDPSRSILKALQWLRPDGMIHVEVPSSDWLVNKLINFYYKLTGSDYVGNISPMHVPFHLYEFSSRSFHEHAKKHNYEIADYGYYVCETYMPKLIDFLIRPYMKKTNTGMQLEIWLRKI